MHQRTGHEPNEGVQPPRDGSANPEALPFYCGRLVGDVCEYLAGLCCVCVDAVGNRGAYRRHHHRRKRAACAFRACRRVRIRLLGTMGGHPCSGRRCGIDRRLRSSPGARPQHHHSSRALSQRGVPCLRNHHIGGCGHHLLGYLAWKAWWPESGNYRCVCYDRRHVQWHHHDDDEGHGHMRGCMDSARQPAVCVHRVLGGARHAHDCSSGSCPPPQRLYIICQPSTVDTPLPGVCDPLHCCCSMCLLPGG